VFADLGTLHERRRRPASDSPTFAANDAGGEDTPVESEDFGSIMLRFASGARGALTVSQVSAGRKNRLFLELDAEAAALAWDQEEPNRLWIGRRDEANGELLRDPALLEGGAATLTRYPGGHAEGWPDALRNLCADFYAAVDAKRRRQPYEASFASLDEGHRLVELVEAVVASHRSQQWAEVRRPEGVTA
jgi:predicted dehydrogenase